MSDIQTLKVEQLKKEIADYYQILKIFPASSPLGRMSIEAIIRHKEKKLNRLLNRNEKN